MSTQTYRLTISYNTAGQFAQNVLHYNFDDSGYATSVDAANALITAWKTHCFTQLKAALSTHTQVLSFKARRETGGGGFEAVQPGVGGDVGTRTGDLSASGLSPMIRFITNVHPVKSGRMFLPGISDDDADDGCVTPSYFGVLGTLAGLLDDAITLAGGGTPSATPVVLSHFPFTTAITISPAVACTWLSTQRRRQRPA